MFRQMRRKDHEVSKMQALEWLQSKTCGVLSLSGDDGYPYGVPLNYVYHDGAIYFHSAKSGHKLDAISRNEKASFCVIVEEALVPERYTGMFRSVIVFGRMSLLTDLEEKRYALELLGTRFGPEEEKGTFEPAENLRKKVDGGLHSLHMLKLQIEHISGKASPKLMQGR